MFELEKLVKKHKKSILPSQKAHELESRLVLDKKLEKIEPEGPSKNGLEEIPFTPLHILKEINAALIVIALLLILAFVFPQQELIEPRADPKVTPAEIKPAFYFIWIYQTFRYLGNLKFPSPLFWRLFGIFWPAVAVTLLLFVPFLDRNPETNWRKRRVATGVSVLIIAGIIFLQYKGMMAG